MAKRNWTVTFSTVIPLSDDFLSDLRGGKDIGEGEIYQGLDELISIPIKDASDATLVDAILRFDNKQGLLWLSYADEDWPVGIETVSVG